MALLLLRLSFDTPGSLVRIILVILFLLPISGVDLFRLRTIVTRSIRTLIITQSILLMPLT
ncbi:MAG: hypothetical protein ACFFAE_21265 [Candidatus Hodarchaeota archaeon]